MLMMAISTIGIGLTGLTLTVVPHITDTLTIGSAVAGLTLTAVLSLAGTRMIGGDAAGPSLTVLPLMASTLMTGNAGVVMVPLGGRSKFSEIQQSTASSTNTTHCGGPFHKNQEYILALLSFPLLGWLFLMKRENVTQQSSQPLQQENRF